MHQLYPQFATQQPGGGGYEQQDANELLTELIREFSEVSECEIMVGSDKKTIPVKNFIEGHYLIRMKNTEDPEEPVQESFEAFMQVHFNRSLINGCTAVREWIRRPCMIFYISVELLP